jgi:hypothetical protein
MELYGATWLRSASRNLLRSSTSSAAASARQIDQEAAWFRVTPGDRDEQLDAIAAAFARDDAQHFDVGAVLGGHAPADFGDGVGGQRHTVMTVCRNHVNTVSMAVTAMPVSRRAPARAREGRRGSG